jgi:hypothetical protein
MRDSSRSRNRSPLGRAAAGAAVLAIALLGLGHHAGAAPGGSAPGRLADLAWMAGHWIDDAGGSLSEEIWAAPASGCMIGMWRYASEGKPKLFELLAILQEDGGPVLRIRHFSPALVAREEKDTPVVLPLVKLEGHEAVFEGQGSAGAVRLTYRQPDPNTLVGVLEKGTTREEFSFRRSR